MSNFYEGQFVTVKSGIVDNEKIQGLHIFTSMNTPGEKLIVNNITGNKILLNNGFVYPVDALVPYPITFDEAWRIGNIVITKDNKRYYINTKKFAVGMKCSISRTDPSIVKIIYHNPTSYGLGFEYNLSDHKDPEEIVIYDKSKQVISEQISKITEEIKKHSAQLAELEAELKSLKLKLNE